jgi:hypothetical protein
MIYLRCSVKSIHRAVSAVVGASFLMGAAPLSRTGRAERPIAPGATEARPEVRPSDFIGILDFYGLRKVTPQQLRKELGLKEGDRMPQSDSEVSAAVRRLGKVPGVVRARLERVCCDEQGRGILFVGIEEKGAPRFSYRPAPRTVASLPPEMVAAYRRYEEALAEAVRKGDAGEDDSQGHSLAANPAVRSVQEQFLSYAAAHVKTLRHVLRNAADAEQRRMAACIIGYAPHKREVVDDLLYAVRDADEGVRNNATRALNAIAALAQRQPEQRIRIEPTPFIAMLNSIVWSDRNKAAAVLMSLTGNRPARVLDPLRERALPSLVEMARWKSPGHALPAYLLLGRIAALEENAIWQAWTRGEREQVIDRALKRSSTSGWPDGFKVK